MKKRVGQTLDSGATYQIGFLGHRLTVCFKSQQNTLDDEERELVPRYVFLWPYDFPILFTLTLPGI